MTWETVTLKPGIDVNAGEVAGMMTSPCGRVLLAILPDRAEIYRRNADGDFVLATKIDLP